MTKHEFLKEVARIYFRDNCDTTSEAIDTAIVELNISDRQFQDWFAKGIKEYREGVKNE